LAPQRALVPQPVTEHPGAGVAAGTTLGSTDGVGVGRAPGRSANGSLPGTGAAVAERRVTSTTSRGMAPAATAPAAQVAERCTSPAGVEMTLIEIARPAALPSGPLHAADEVELTTDTASAPAVAARTTQACGRVRSSARIAGCAGASVQPEGIAVSVVAGHDANVICRRASREPYIADDSTCADDSDDARPEVATAVDTSSRENSRSPRHPSPTGVNAAPEASAAARRYAGAGPDAGARSASRTTSVRMQHGTLPSTHADAQAAPPLAVVTDVNPDAVRITTQSEEKASAGERGPRPCHSVSAFATIHPSSLVCVCVCVCVWGV
jgi:hypothetical protein